VRTFSDATYQIPNQLVEYAQRNPHVPWDSGARRACRTPSTASASSTSWRHAPARTRWNSACRCSRPTTRTAWCSKPRQGANWGAPLPAGVFRGIAQSDGFGSHTAMVAEVSVKDGAIKVHRVVFAIDSGYVVNPDACRAQAEGNVIYCIGQLYQAHTI
jgi:isoquinoline 1-oxidoreductase beta subunit